MGKGREGGDGGMKDMVREGMCEGGAIVGEAQALRRPTSPPCTKTTRTSTYTLRVYTSFEAKTHPSKRTAYEKPQVEAATIPTIIIPNYEIDAPLDREGQPSSLKFSRRNHEMNARCEYAAEHRQISRC